MWLIYYWHSKGDFSIMIKFCFFNSIISVKFFGEIRVGLFFFTLWSDTGLLIKIFDKSSSVLTQGGTKFFYFIFFQTGSELRPE
jgi:hypothetical protein